MLATDIQIKNQLGFDYDKHEWCVYVGWEMGRLEFFYHNTNFDAAMNQLVAQEQDEIIAVIKPMLEKRGVTLHDEMDDYQMLNLNLIQDLKAQSGREFSFYMIGMACARLSMASIKDSAREEMRRIAWSCIASIPSQYLEDKQAFFDALDQARFEHIEEVADFLTQLRNEQERQRVLNGIEAASEEERLLEIEHLQKLLAQYQESKRVLEEQISKFGLEPPLHLVVAKQEHEKEIQRIQATLQKWLEGEK